MRLAAAASVELGVDVLVTAGVPEPAALLQTSVLVEAEMRGHPSHGLLRLPRLVERIRNGVLDPRATGAHRWANSGLLAVDGERGLGPVVATRALDEISLRARETGIALAAIRSANHLGMLAWYVERVAEGGQIAVALTTSEALVYPWGGRQAQVGSNPIAIGVPSATGPLVLDMATAMVSMGKIIDHANRGVALDPSWAIDEHGNPTTDAVAARSGAISPFGGPKGYGLGLALEVLVAALTGSASGREVVGTLDSVHPANKGDVFIVIDQLLPEATFAVAAYLEAVRQSEPQVIDQPVRVPGDGARARRARALADGIEVPDGLMATLEALRGPHDATETDPHPGAAPADLVDGDG